MVTPLVDCEVYARDIDRYRFRAYSCAAPRQVCRLTALCGCAELVPLDIQSMIHGGLKRSRMAAITDAFQVLWVYYRRHVFEISRGQ
jgi:hypothetical protein